VPTETVLAPRAGNLRTFGPDTSGELEVLPAFPNCPPGFIGSPPNCFVTGFGSNTCANRCAGSCQSAPTPEDYDFCYQQCYNAYCIQGPPPQGGSSGGSSGGSCIAPSGSCSAAAYCECLKTVDPNLPNGPGECYLLYGPPHGGMTCCASHGNVNLKTNSANCGACGHQCVGGAICCGGSCCGGTANPNTGCCYSASTGASCVPDSTRRDAFRRAIQSVQLRHLWKHLRRPNEHLL